MQCLLANITQVSQTSDSVSKEKVNALCNEFSEFFNETAYSCNNYSNGSNTANNNLNHGLDTSAISHLNMFLKRYPLEAKTAPQN